MTRARRVVVTPLEWAVVGIASFAAIACGAYLLAFHLRDALGWLLHGPVLAVLR